MKKYLSNVRKPGTLPTTKKIFDSVLLLFMGILLGIAAKILDETASNVLPPIFQVLDLGNFFSRMGVWLFIGICISVYSYTPLRASLNTFLFLAGMVGSYYIYTIFIAGFFPKSYMILWIAMTIFSPLPAFLCWYAKGTHILSLCISAILLLFMARQAFSFGVWYFNVRYILEMLLFVGTIGVLYKTPKQISIVVVSGIILFLMVSPINLIFGLF